MKPVAQDIVDAVLIFAARVLFVLNFYLLLAGTCFLLARFIQ